MTDNELRALLADTTPGRWTVDKTGQVRTGRPATPADLRLMALGPELARELLAARARLAGIKANVTEIERRLDSVGTSLAHGGSTGPRFAEGQLALLQRWLREHFG